MKKLLSIMLIVLMFITLCACSGNGNEAEPQNNEPQNNEPQNDGPEPGIDAEPNPGAYTEADFNLQFEDFDGLVFTDGNVLTLKEAYGMWEALITKIVDGDSDRELGFVTIFEDGGKVLMDIDPRFREEGEHRGETNHTYDLFEMIEESPRPKFKLMGMLITVDTIFEKDGYQYLLGKMDIDEINEHHDIVMLRPVLK